MKILITGSAIVFMALAGCSAMGPKTELAAIPDNYTVTRDGYDQPFLDEGVYTFSAPEAASFTDRVALCGEKTLAMDGFEAKTTQNWVGPATGTLYKSTAGSKQVSESNIVRYVSEAEDTVLLANREIIDESTALSALTGQQDLFKDALQYDIEAKLLGDVYSLTVSNIQRASLETQGYQNRGFAPVGAWEGSSVSRDISAIKSNVARLNECIQGG